MKKRNGKTMVKNKFRVIIPVYNAEEYIEQCLTSLSNQVYDYWTAIVVDDASTDNTGKIIDEFIKKDERFKVIHHHHNIGNVVAFIEGTLDCEDEDIIINLDGDDYLYDRNVLNHLNEVYQDENIWLTYGSYRNKGGWKRPPREEILKNSRTFRKKDHMWNMHLRTYKYKIFKLVKDEDLRDKNGNYYKVTGDLAIMVPMIEMCGMNRIKEIKKVLYIYNNMNPLCDFRIRKEEQKLVKNEIRQKPVYEEIK